MGTEREDRHEDDERRVPFRPRMGRRPVADQRVPRFGAAMARLVAQRGGIKKGVGRTLSKRGRIAVRAPHSLSRRCVIKARYVTLTANGCKVAKAHLAYLERDGVERDGSPGRLYGADERFDAEAFRKPLDREPRQFRFIVSPEDAHLLDLSEFTRQLMRQVEKDTGRPLNWAAVNHHNTDNPHVHIVVRGLDRDGDEVRIDGRYIAREMRWRAQEIATRELGPRMEFELSNPRSSEVDRARPMEIDRVIESLVAPERTISVRDVLAELGSEGRLCIARVHSLEKLGFAMVEEPGVWRLQSDWQTSLRELGEYQQVRERLWPIVGDRSSAFQIVDEKNPVPAFEGRVIGKGLDDELGGRMFVAVRTAGGESYYVRLAPAVAEPVRDSDTIRVAFDAERWVKPADRIIARAAEENGGVYDPARHQRALETLQRSRLVLDEPTPAERVGANVHRLERLERYQLATRLADGRWQIGPDLLTKLEERERTYPQPRMRVDRIGQERAQAPGQPARGSERASAPARESLLEVAKERAALGQALAKQNHRIYVGDPPTFRGWVVDCVTAPSGRQYARVMNELRGEFTLIPKPPQWERIHGTTITLALDRERRLVIQRDLGLSR